MRGAGRMLAIGREHGRVHAGQLHGRSRVRVHLVRDGPAGLVSANYLTAVTGAAIVFFMFPGMDRGALPFLAMTLSATALCALCLFRNAGVRRLR